MKHEAFVERFYSFGVERFGEWHGTYLNFGFWDAGTTDYVAAAEALVDRVATMIGLGTDASLLDVACGMGSQDRHLIERFGCRSIVAIDLTRKHIEIARARHPHPNVAYRVGDACRLDAEAASFSHVLAIEGIVHFDTRERFVREAHRVLRPNGRLGVADYFLARAPRTAVERALLALTVRAWHVPRANVCGIDAYHRVLVRSGFRDVDLQVVTDAVIPGYVAEQRRAESRRAQIAIRGHVIGRLGTVIDGLVERAHRRGLLGYVLGAATKA